MTQICCYSAAMGTSRLMKVCPILSETALEEGEEDQKYPWETEQKGEEDLEDPSEGKRKEWEEDL